MLRPWYVCLRPLDQRTGSQVFQALYGEVLQNARVIGSQNWRAIATLLESPYPLPPGDPQSRIARYSICAGPPRHQDNCPQVWTPQIGEILAMLTNRLATPKPEAILLDEMGSPLRHTLEPFAGGWLGWLGYDLAWEIESLPTHNYDSLPFPVAFWYEPDTFAVLDHQDQHLWLAASAPQQLIAMERAIATSHPTPPPKSVQFTAPLNLAASQMTYEAAVRQAKAHIEMGDIFQANLSLRFSTQTQADSWAIYRQLHEINPSPFASYWHTPWGAIISCSPTVGIVAGRSRRNSSHCRHSTSWSNGTARSRLSPRAAQ